MGSLVERTDCDGWVTLTLNRPEKLNALTVDVFAQLRSHIDNIRDDAGVRCVILRGAGKCFSAGHDLTAIASSERTPSRGWHSETLRLLERLPVPVIAAVHGHCYTGALEVALACDFIVAADDARFGDTHAKWGLTPIWGMSQRLPRRVGIAAAKRLMFSCDMIDAREAARIGLVEYVVPASDFDGEIAQLASRIASNSSFSHRANKRLLEVSDGWPIDAGLQWEVMENEGVSPDMQERVASFTRKGR